MAQYYYDNQSAIYRGANQTKRIQLDISSNQITVTKGTQTSTFDNNSLQLGSTALLNPVQIVLQGDTSMGQPAQLTITDNTTQSLGMIIDPSIANGFFAANLASHQVGLLEGAQLTMRDNPDPASVVNSSTLTNTTLTIANTPSALQSYIDNTQLIITQSGTGITINANNGGQILYNNGTVGQSIGINGSNQLELLGNNADIIVNTQSANCVIGDVFNTVNGTKVNITDANANLDLTAYDLTTSSSTYTLPVVLTSKSSGTVNYGSASSWDNVFHYHLNFPSNFVNPLSTFNIWKLDVTLNCTNMTDQANKELAIYCEFRDGNGNSYTPWLFNQSTPYTNHRNQSTYSASSTQSENYQLINDYVDFTGVNSAVPFDFRLWWYSNSTNTFDFQMLVSLIRTNLV